MLDVFVGRRAELAFLDERLKDARRGTPCAVFIEGAAGIGKTALLSRFLHTHELRVLRATGDDLEAGLAFGLVEQLFRGVELPWDQHLARLVSGREHAGAGDQAEVLAVGADIVDTLGVMDRDGPVALVIDDAHWADWASVQALAFALRRLRAEPVLAVISTRDTVAERLPECMQRLLAGELGMRLQLRGLELDELRLLSAALGAGPLSCHAAARLKAHTRGNPLHARALFEELPPDFLRDGTRPLPAPRSFAMLVVGRLARCSPEAERLVVAVSVLGRCQLDLAARVAELEQPLVALEEAIAARLLEEQHCSTERLISFPHPLLHAAVYRDLGPARRSSLHARAAALLSDEPTALHHRVAATADTDAVLSTEVAATARRLAAAGAWSDAVDTLAEAIRLGSHASIRERLLLEAAEWMLLGGRTAEARALQGTIAGFKANARQRLVLGRLALVTGARAKAELLLADAWRRCDAEAEPAVAARIAGLCASVQLTRGNGLRASVWARRALRTDPAVAGAEHLNDVLLLSLGISGRSREADALSAAPLASALATGPPDGLVGRGVLRLWRGDVVAARDDLTAALTAYLPQGCGPVHIFLMTLAALADAEYRLGDWDQSLIHGRDAVAAAEDADQRWLTAVVHAVASFVLVGRGAWEGAEAHAQAALGAAGAAGDAASTAYAASARALLAATRNDPGGVVAAVEPLLGLCAPEGMGTLGVLPWPELYVDALIELSRLDEAERRLVHFEARVRACDQPTLRTVGWRLRGNLEVARRNSERARIAYLEGLHVSGLCDQPLEQAKLELAYGSLLRRIGSRADAAERLALAQERFARLGARPGLERCARELAACGAAKTKVRTRQDPQLTSQERAVADLVAAGCSNREVATELVISVKTVEFHLGNVFSKLGVRSRSRLIVELQRAGERA
jgi:DNA-binding CsgD family transcriptional regulator